MNLRFISLIGFGFIIGLFLSSCGPRQAVEPTFTTYATITATFTPAQMDTPTPEPTVTPEATSTPSLLQGQLSGLAAAPDMTVDSAGLHITLPDSSRVVDVTTENVAKQIVFDSEYSLYKIYDEKGNISAEYDPGQGKEGDVDYVPSTGWVDVQKLAKDLVCKMGDGVNCMTSYSNSHTSNSVWYETNSTGLFRYSEVEDSSTGENLGRVLLLQMVSRDNLQNPITSWFMVQEEASYDPGVNKVSYVAQCVLVNMEDFSSYKKDVLLDLNQWAKWMPRGTMWTFSLAKSGWNYTYLLNKNPTESENISQEIVDFISSKGKTSPKGGAILRANGFAAREAQN